MAGLLSVESIDQDPADYVRRQAVVVATFDHRTQDSGNVSWLVDAGGRRLFVKTAGRDAPPAPDGPVPYFAHPARVGLLRNAIDLARSVSHSAMPRLLNVLESPEGPALVYEAAEGELVGVPRAQRSDSDSAYQRFAHLPTERLLRIFDQLIGLHAALAARGWVAVDLYDGCLIVDFATGQLKVVDLDSYRRGPSTNDMGRMFGSTRFMGPEEFEPGAPIDQRTTVFTLGRLVWHFGTRLSERGEDFSGPMTLADVAHWACRPFRSERPPTVAAFADAWRTERAGMNA